MPWGERCDSGLAVLLVASAAGACGTDAAEQAGPTTSEQPSASEEPVTVEVERSRLFEQQRSLGVTVHNAGASPVVVDDVRFAAGRYAEVPAADRTVTVPAGGEVSFPVPYGVARCERPPDDIVVLLSVDGRPGTRSVPVSAQVHRAHQRECATAEVLDAVELGFGDDWALVGPRRAQGTLTVTPRDGREAEVDAVSTSIVFVTEVLAGATPAAVPLDVVAARCDTHALIESKKTFTFTVSVSVDGGDAVPVEVVPPDGAARRRPAARHRGLPPRRTGLNRLGAPVRCPRRPPATRCRGAGGRAGSPAPGPRRR